PDDLLVLGHLGDLGLGALLGRTALLAADGDGDAAPHQVGEVLLGVATLLRARPAIGAAAILVAADVHQLAAAAHGVGDDLELTALAQRLLAGRHGDVLVRRGRGGHPADLDERAADDHRLRRGRTQG